jgi:hypothetical protein
MGPLLLAALVVVVAVVAFAASVGVGILLGRRLDRIVEGRASAESDAGREVDRHE